MRGMTRILRGLGVAVYWESAWYTEMSPRASFHPVAEENGRVMTWADMDSPRPWVAWISAGSDTRLPVSCVSFALRLRYSQPRLDGRAKAWIRLGCLDGFSRLCGFGLDSSVFSLLSRIFRRSRERLMFLGQLNVRRMSGDRIASVCRLRARAPNYLPPILLSYFTGDVTLDDRIRGLCCVPN
ncbi:hypothetical protein ISN45_Aa03g040340 [Arabidopsis thaliana x Arabidopsis arenosa]|uniref:Uncharacterized protein n=1 Tax=Arabidopsis thaliana x Arabidopsis arenosa TaxID=1240361 RepID=A0A8T2B0Q5_9BRAS|nr:hypothetical protein ISN45_Aa03g040340 [Arabidopsis thaliana x Arabidopsis arenosa]